MELKPTSSKRALRVALAAGGVLLALGGAVLVYRNAGAAGASPLLGSREESKASSALAGDSDFASAVADGSPGSEGERKAGTRRAARAGSDDAAQGSVRGSAATLGAAAEGQDSDARGATVRGTSGDSARTGGAAVPADGAAFTGGVALGPSSERAIPVQRGGGVVVTGQVEGALEQAPPGSRSGATPFSQGSPNAAVGPGGAVCGDGVLNGAEECEPNRSPTCSDDCVSLLSDQCYTCAQETPCIQLANSCLEFTSSEDEQAVCYDVMECVQDSGCAANSAGLTSCFCGSLSTAQCVAAPPGGDAGPDGPCADIIRRAAGGDGTPNSLVLTRYLQRTNPAGIALRYLNCLNTNPTCGPVCFPR